MISHESKTLAGQTVSLDSREKSNNLSFVFNQNVNMFTLQNRKHKSKSSEQTGVQSRAVAVLQLACAFLEGPGYFHNS